MLDRVAIGSALWRITIAIVVLISCIVVSGRLGIIYGNGRTIPLGQLFNYSDDGVDHLGMGHISAGHLWFIEALLRDLRKYWMEVGRFDHPLKRVGIARHRDR